MGDTHKLSVCGIHGKADHFWHSDKRQKTGGRWECRECATDSARRAGIRPIGEVKSAPLYLGVVVAERVLSSIFDVVDKMPFGFPGYDFVCGRGRKIDVKASCLTKVKNHTSHRWRFHIRHNIVPDYFLCIGFNNREALTPMHIWLVPSSVVSHLVHLSISDSTSSLAKWEKYERPIDRAIMCCDQLKAVA